MDRGLVFAGLALGVGCEPPEPAAPVAAVGTTAPSSANRALQISGCDTDGTVPNVSGVWLVRFETTSKITGRGLSSQDERITRYAVMELCQDRQAVSATLLTCVIHQSAVLDASETFAAQLPASTLLEHLPAIRMGGQLDINNPEAVLSFEWSESWGLEPNKLPPREPTGFAEASGAGVIDQDEDGRPGVTLRGSGPVPTITWAARYTRSRLEIQGGDEVVMLGRTTGTQTLQTILGGPAVRVIRGRTREGGVGGLAMVRVDGRFGTTVADTNRDGQVSCAELAPFVGPVLTVPQPAACGE